VMTPTSVACLPVLSEKTQIGPAKAAVDNPISVVKARTDTEASLILGHILLVLLKNSQAPCHRPRLAKNGVNKMLKQKNV